MKNTLHKHKLFFSLLTILLINVIMVSALRTTLLYPQATFRVNQSTPIDYYIGVENKNPYPMNITYILPDSLEIYFHDSLYFELQPNETRISNYTINTDNAGNYSEYISVLFNGNGTSFSLQQSLFIYVYGNLSNGTNNQSSNETYSPECDNCSIYSYNETQPDNNSYKKNFKHYLETFSTPIAVTIIILLIIIVIIIIIDEKRENRIRELKNPEDYIESE